MHTTSYVLGVDVSKHSLAVCLRNRADRQIVFETSIDNETTAIQQLLQSMPVSSPESVCLAIEPTNTYWLDCANHALAAGYKVVSAPPGPAKLFLRSLNPRAKNDKLDAKGIALYAATMQLKPYLPKTQTLAAVQQLLALRRKVSETIAYYAGVVSDDTAAHDIAGNLLEHSKQQLAELDRQIRQHLKDFQQASRISAVPGFGPVLTAALLVRLLSTNFKSSDAFVAYVGLDLKVRESGNHKGRRFLSHNGDAELRRLLYLAAQASIRAKDSPFSKIYHDHKARGLTSTEAICVVARKLARTAWSIVKYNTAYDPTRVSSQDSIDNKP
jgi:transposase